MKNKPYNQEAIAAVAEQLQLSRATVTIYLSQKGHRGDKARKAYEKALTATPGTVSVPPQQPLTSAEADVLAYAVRYALGRPETVASLTVAEEVIRKWDGLQPWHRQQMQKEILETRERPRIWQRVLDLTA